MTVPAPKLDLGIDMPSSPTIMTISWSQLRTKAKDQNTIGLCRAENFKQSSNLEFGDHTEKDGSQWVYVSHFKMRQKPEVNIYLASEMNKDKACKSYVLEHEKHHYKDYKSFAANYAAGLKKLVLKENLAIELTQDMTAAKLKAWAKTVEDRLFTLSKTYSDTFFTDMMAASAKKHDTKSAYDTAYTKCKSCLGLK